MAPKMRFIESRQSAEELSVELFGVLPHVLLGGTPLTCTIPEAGAVVDVSLPTMYGSSISRFKPHAVIEHLARSLDDPSTNVYALWTDEDVPATSNPDFEQTLHDAEARIRVENDNAATIAHYLACHPNVAEVFYPGLKSDASFAAAAQVLVHGFGNAIEYCTEDDAAIRRICVTADDVFDQIEALEQRLL